MDETNQSINAETGKPDGPPQDTPTEELKAIFNEFERDTHKEPSLEAVGDLTSGAGLDLVYEDQRRSGRYIAAPPSNFVIVDYHNGTIVTADGQPVSQLSSPDFKDWTQVRPGTLRSATKDAHDSLSQEVKRYLQSETRTRISRNQKKGKIDQRKLYKLGVQGASSDWQERVFWKKESKLSVKETKVSLVCDISGSMQGQKMKVALRSMDLLGNVCEALGIDYEMAGFTTDWYGQSPVHCLYKPFGIKTQRTQIIKNILGSTAHMSGNADGENVLYAYQRLLAQEAKRRVLIVLSDGQPAAAGGDICKFTNDVTAGIENSGLVELHGIGIMSSAVKGYYKSHDVIHSVNQLEPALLSVLKNTVIRLK